HPEDHLFERPSRDSADDRGIEARQRCWLCFHPRREGAEVHGFRTVPEFVRRTQQILHVPAGAATEYRDSHQSSPKDFLTSPGSTRRKRWQFPVFKLRNSTSAGENSSGAIL